MKRKIAYILTTSALVMSAFLIGKTMSTQKTVEPKPNAKQYLAVNDIQSIDYYVIKNKLTINTSTDSYDFVPTVNGETETDNICQVYDSSELTEDVLANRQGKLIIEKCVGKVLDDEKNGAIQNADSDYNYISYADVDCTKGDTVTTYLIYNPETNYTDDVIERFDYVQKGE
ncbi:hypothetical protein DW172_03625 [Agathobacter rectalis]|uniref:DUF5067 domain-containing protein n=1 Tax=Agathobacter rectalis TaxID=39491 RepID=A0A414ZR92_9FIRM|nr:hypothetical protein [Agathobacter rectalis]RHI25783.1 hypothetical protein DW172_03625 [Agathobacter rectalis]